MTAQLLQIAGDIRDYAWGSSGGISRALGHAPTEAIEAELWLGSHPSSPSRIISTDAGHTDLAAWESDGHGPMPFLLKLLAAASPLSLQAHPTPTQALEGFDRENALGIPLAARERNYKDPFAKPELIVALEDGFEALCGFRPIADTRAAIHELAISARDAAPFREWDELLGNPGGLRDAFEWLLAYGAGPRSIVEEISTMSAAIGRPWLLGRSLSEKYPGDPGVAIALMLNHVTLAAGQALWLPAGNIHAYLRGVGVELMGPSDNVLRGGLTTKHVDQTELQKILDFSDGAPPILIPRHLTEHVRTYRPPVSPTGEHEGFQLYDIIGSVTLPTTSPSIGLVTSGAFSLTVSNRHMHLERGQAAVVTDSTDIHIEGSGRLFLASE
ncbi:mannose-6-phosphate isomerase, class I [Microbacterium sp. KSW4-11]|uniref:mannose-6-phosphate isomerase n=1 Tax=Microbacterium gawkjiense TaxID=3067309 RepID=A0ABU3GE54_9MICO|nr:mannose-6-phosphate isomerase, class I [Microbacterium sp. KSW4-11]MDT3318084.1 mannose-6-phosphate isomerase, class I [Microbacterium sp. KSW4-11]